MSPSILDSRRNSIQNAAQDGPITLPDNVGKWKTGKAKPHGPGDLANTIDLTMSRYSHVFAGQEADAVAALPDLGLPVAEKAKATGTDGRVATDDGDGDDDPPRPPRRPRDGRGARSDDETRGAPRDAKTGSARLALFLAQDGGFRRISPNLDGSKTPSGHPTENTGKPSGNSAESETNEAPGEVSERLMEPVSKTGVRLAVPWVRIPPSPLCRAGTLQASAIWKSGTRNPGRLQNQFLQQVAQEFLPPAAAEAVLLQG